MTHNSFDMWADYYAANKLPPKDMRKLAAKAASYLACVPVLVLMWQNTSAINPGLEQIMAQVLTMVLGAFLLQRIFKLFLEFVG